MFQLLVPFGLVCCSAELSRLEYKWVHKGVWVSKADDLAALQRLSSINQAIIIGEPLEGSWIYYSCRGKPTTVQTNIWRSTSGNTGVDYLDYVPWDSRCGISTLWDAYISIRATALWEQNKTKQNIKIWSWGGCLDKPYESVIWQKRKWFLRGY